MEAEIGGETGEAVPQHMGRDVGWQIARPNFLQAPLAAARRTRRTGIPTSAGQATPFRKRQTSPMWDAWGTIVRGGLLTCDALLRGHALERRTIRLGRASGR